MRKPTIGERRRSVAVVGVWAVALGATAAVAGQMSIDAERPFLKEIEVAMDHMMVGMAPKPTGDVDHDFTAMMIPHHQGAIDMAIAELKYGRNDRLKRIAQEIIVDQQQEIAAMHLALGEAPPPSTPAPTQLPSAQPSPDQEH